MLPLTAAGIYLFKTLDARNGLNSSQINCILKDSRGFIWLVTTDIHSNISNVIHRKVPHCLTAILQAYRNHSKEIFG